jgi:hypothetical protein
MKLRGMVLMGLQVPCSLLSFFPDGVGSPTPSEHTRTRTLDNVPTEDEQVHW